MDLMPEGLRIRPRYPREVLCIGGSRHEERVTVSSPRFSVIKPEEGRFVAEWYDVILCCVGEVAFYVAVPADSDDEFKQSAAAEAFNGYFYLTDYKLAMILEWIEGEDRERALALARKRVEEELNTHRNVRAE